MAEPKIAARNPAVMELEPGTYYWCSCGSSQKQPFCDGSHAGSAFQPQAVEITEKRRVALCQCKRTGDRPYCDGKHSSL
jgi:CDGSH-type Zn-finger protein